MTFSRASTPSASPLRTTAVEARRGRRRPAPARRARPRRAAARSPGWSRSAADSSAWARARRSIMSSSVTCRTTATRPTSMTDSSAKRLVRDSDRARRRNARTQRSAGACESDRARTRVRRGPRTGDVPGRLSARADRAPRTTRSRSSASVAAGDVVDRPVEDLPVVRRGGAHARDLADVLQRSGAHVVRASPSRCRAGAGSGCSGTCADRTPPALVTRLRRPSSRPSEGDLVLDLTGTSSLVTGGASGLGEATRPRAGRPRRLRRRRRPAGRAR